MDWGQIMVQYPAHVVEKFRINPPTFRLANNPFYHLSQSQLYAHWVQMRVWATDVAWPDESWFMLQHSNVRVIIWHELIIKVWINSVLYQWFRPVMVVYLCEDIQVSADVSSTLKNQCLWESCNSPTVKVLLLHYQITFFFLCSCCWVYLSHLGLWF